MQRKLRRAHYLTAGIIFGGVVFACGGDDSGSGATSSPDGGGSSSGTSSSGASSSGSSGDSSTSHVPNNAAAGVTVATDSVKACSLVSADVSISRAADESDLTDYVIYWGSDAATKIGSAIGTVSKTGGNLTFSLVNVARPTNATYILVFTKNSTGEMATGVSTTFTEVGQYITQEIAAGQDVNSGLQPSVAIDGAGAKLLVVTKNGQNSNKAALFRCDLNGTGCGYSDVSGGQDAESGTLPTALVDTTNNKLLVVTASGATPKPALSVCDLNGSNCGFVDISAGKSAGVGEELTATLDKTNSKLVVATRNGANNHPAMFRCDLSGANCAFTDVALAAFGASGDVGHWPSVVVDEVNSKVLVVSTNLDNNSKLALFRCDLDGSNCTYTDISAGQGTGSGYAPKALIDTLNKKLLVVTNNAANAGKLALFRCDLNGTNCVYADISAAQPGTSLAGNRPAAMIDPVGRKLLVASIRFDSADRPGLWRCELDGTQCTFYDFTRAGTEGFIAAAFNPTTRSVFVSLVGTTNTGKPTFVGICGY